MGANVPVGVGVWGVGCLAAQFSQDPPACNKQRSQHAKNSRDPDPGMILEPMPALSTTLWALGRQGNQVSKCLAHELFVAMAGCSTVGVNCSGSPAL